jgi:hypothetical protein
MVHTPGPWDIHDPSGGGSSNNWICADGLYIAEVDGEREEADANARLIAAAPDLLAALKDAVEYLELQLKCSGEDSGEGAMIRLFQKTIAEAEGNP